MESRKLLEMKEKELQEKYADVINDIAVANGVTMDVAFCMFLAIPRALMLGLTPAYQTSIELNYAELKNDYLDYLELCKKVIG